MDMKTIAKEWDPNFCAGFFLIFKTCRNIFIIEHLDIC